MFGSHGGLQFGMLLMNTGNLMIGRALRKLIALGDRLGE